MIQIELIYNLSLLVALSVLSGFIDSYYPFNTVRGKVFQGLLFGCAAVMGMMNPYVLSEGLIFDGRSVLLSIAALFFGPVSAIIAALITITYRFMIGGPGTTMGVLVIIESILIGLFFHYHLTKKKKSINTNFLLQMGFSVHLIMLMLMAFLPSALRTATLETLSISILTIYPLATILVGKIMSNQENNRKLLIDVKKSEDNLKTYFNSAPDAIFVVDDKGNYIESNIAAQKMTGYSKSELVNMSVTDFCPTGDLNLYKNHFNFLLENGISFGELRFVRKDGSIGWWSVEAVKIADNKYLGYSKDITQKKESEIFLQESLNEFQTVFNLAPDAMTIVSLDDDVFIDLNTMHENLFRFSKEELVGKSPSKFNFWKNPDNRSEFLNQLISQNYIKGFEAEMQNRYGDTINALISASVIKINQKKHVLAVITDITEKKEAESKLKESELKYRKFIEKLPDGFYRSTPEGKFLFVNPAMANMLGYNSPEELYTIDIVKELYFLPEEREIDEIISHKDDYEIYRLKRKDGGLVWIEEHSKYILDENNEIVLHEGICRDITDRIISEKANAELIERMKKVSAHLPGFIYQFEMKPDGTFTFPYSSDGIIDIYGVTSEEVKINTDKVLKALHPEDVDRVIKSILKSAENLSIWREEYRSVLPSGQVIWVEGYSSPEKLDDGTVLWHGYISDISERKKIEDSIRENEFSLKYAQEIAKMDSWEYDVINRKVKWSENYFRLFGFDEQSFVPENFSFLERVHPEDYDYVAELVHQYDTTPQSGSFEYRIILPDGRIKWIQNSFTPIFDDDKLIFFKGVNLDITERKKSENNLRKLSRGIEQSPLSVIITNLDGDIEYVNPKFSELTGYSFDEVIGQNPRILKSDKMPIEFYIKMWETLSSGHVWQSEIINKKKNGDLYWESVTIAPVVDEKGKITNYIAIKEDVSEKKRLYDELIKEKEHAEESDRLKSAFIANMSHEIRTPMNGIIGFSKLLGSSDLNDEERHEYSQVLNASCNRLMNTVNDILDISKIESNQMEVKKDYFSIYKLIQELFDFYSANFSEKGISFSYQVTQSECELILFSDEQKIYQILNNLISNALKFTKSGEVVYGYKIIEGTIEFFVKDTGIGISEEAIDFIFGRFNQENNDFNRGFEGTGLGLPICQGLAMLLGGEINVKSKHGEGSIFYLTIPLGDLS